MSLLAALSSSPAQRATRRTAAGRVRSVLKRRPDHSAQGPRVASGLAGVHARATVPSNVAQELMMAVNRWLPLSGLLFVVLVLVAVVGLAGDTPGSDATAAELASFYDEEEVRQAIGAFVWAASIPFLVFFAVCVARRFPDVQQVWQQVLVGGSVLTGAIVAILSAAHFAMVDGANNDVSAGLQALSLIGANGWVAFNAGFGVMMLGAAGCLIPRLRSYRWLGWIALVLGIALFIPFADFIALILTLVWIIVVSVMLFRDTDAATGSPISHQETFAD